MTTRRKAWTGILIAATIFVSGCAAPPSDAEEAFGIEYATTILGDEAERYVHHDDGGGISPSNSLRYVIPIPEGVSNEELTRKYSERLGALPGAGQVYQSKGRDKDTWSAPDTRFDEECTAFPVCTQWLIPYNDTIIMAGVYTPDLVDSYIPKEGDGVDRGGPWLEPALYLEIWDKEKLYGGEYRVIHDTQEPPTPPETSPVTP